MEYIERAISAKIKEYSRYYQVVVITGPRQTGKTTLCRHLFEDYTYYNLEDISLRLSVQNDPKGFLASCGQSVIIDEAQNIPDLFSYIQITVDQYPDRKFVLTGSNNFALMENITQSLAGRACLFTLLPFSIRELSGRLADVSADEMMLRGFYPGTLTKGIPHKIFYSNYYTTYIERDLRQLKQITDIGAFQRLVRLIAGRTSSELNASALANETGISAPTVKAWNALLETSYITYPLRPYYANISKRLTKSPKIYFTDTGLLCFLLGINTVEQLSTHPLRGAIFENLVITEMIKEELNNAEAPNLYFYRENSGREVDILKETAGKLDLYEVKSSATFNPAFMDNLKYLEQLFPDKVHSASLIYTGDNIPPNIYNYKNLFTNP